MKHLIYMSNNENNFSYSIRVITCFPPWLPCWIHRRVPCHSLSQNRTCQTETAIVVLPSPLDVASDIIKKRFKNVKLMEPLAHLLKAIHVRVSVLPVAICFVAICTIAICRIARWVLHALVVGVAYGERVNQTNNQLIVGSTLLLDELDIGGGLWDEAEEGLCGNLMGACCGGGSQRKINGGVTIDGRRQDQDGCRRHKRSMDGGISDDNGRRRKDTTIKKRRAGVPWLFATMAVVVASAFR